MTTPSDGTVDRIFRAVADEAAAIRADLAAHRDYAGERNPSGERQLAADVTADRRLADRLGDVDGVGAYASEERDGVRDVGDGYAVAVDPLDGSSNIPTANPAGTIVGVYDADLPARGRDLVAAGYVLYGSVTTMVVASEGTVTEYVLADGERYPATGDLSLPPEPTVFGFGGGVDAWPADFTEFAEATRRDLKLRYAGALVADVNQVLHRGGVFAYPGLVDRPEGKLRLQFECNPVAYVIETAGGASSTGAGSVLDADPGALHRRVPFHVGSQQLIDELEATLDSR